MDKPLIMQAGKSDVLPSDYYLANFHSLASFVQENYRDILSDAENHWYAQLVGCPVAAQQLYIRLLTRKRSNFRLSKLSYPEIPCLEQASAALRDTGLAVVEPSDCLQTLVAAFTKPDIIRLLALNVSSSISRVDLVNLVVGAEADLRKRYLLALQQDDQWIAISGHQHWTVYTLCFFGNLYQSSVEFVLRDLGNVQYEPYQISSENRAFASRLQVVAHLRYFECEALFDTIDTRQEDQLMGLMLQLPEPIASDIHLMRRLDRLRNRVARQLERLGSTMQALALFEDSIHPPARERRARIHMKRGELELAQVIIRDMLDQPYNDAEKSVAERLVRQSNKEQGIKAPTESRFRPPTSTLVLQDTTARVEIAARSFYARRGACFYTENSLVSAVLGLFIWDIMFYPVSGVFFNPFQSAPADFYEPDFFLKRREMIETRFDELSDPVQFSTRILHRFSEHKGVSNPLVRWGRVSEELLILALQHVPTNHWDAMFRRMLADPRENTTGFPDLVFFHENGGYEFIEIKGPGDVLQQNQRRWMQYFTAHGIPCRVVNVRWGAQPLASPP